MTKMILMLQEYFTSSKPYASIFSLMFVFYFFHYVKKFIRNEIKRRDYSKETEHNIIVIFNIVRILTIITTIMFILQLHGINVSSLISALGVIGIVVGFALQDLLKDWISGLNILINRSFVIGDVIKVNGYTGLVVNLDLNITRIKELYSENVVTISNRQISSVEILSNVIFYNVPFPYEIDLKTCQEMILKMQEEMSSIEGVLTCRYDGTADFMESLVYQRIRVEVEDKMKLPSLKRKLNDVVLRIYDESEWSIPYNHLSVEIEHKERKIK